VLDVFGVLLSLEAAIAAVVGFVILGEELGRHYRCLASNRGNGWCLTVWSAWLAELMKVKMKPVWNSLLLALNLVMSAGTPIVLAEPTAPVLARETSTNATETTTPQPGSSI